jgi:hypothetical protein
LQVIVIEVQLAGTSSLVLQHGRELLARTRIVFLSWIECADVKPWVHLIDNRVQEVVLVPAGRFKIKDTLNVEMVSKDQFGLLDCFANSR